MMPSSFSRAMKERSHEKKRNVNSKTINRRNEPTRDHDDDSQQSKSVNLLLDQDDEVDHVDDDQNSQDSEETEIPSHNPQVATAAAPEEPMPEPNSSPSSASPSSVGVLPGTPLPCMAKEAKRFANLFKAGKGGNHQTVSTSAREHQQESPVTRALMQLKEGERCLLYTERPSVLAAAAAAAAKKTSKNTKSTKKSTPKTALSSSPTPSPPAPKRVVTTSKNRILTQPRLSTIVQYDLPRTVFKSWTVVSVAFPMSERASLGIAIVRNTFPDLAPQPLKKHCVITRIIEETIGEKNAGNQKRRYCGAKYGLRAGDWFLLPGQDYTNQLSIPWTLADFDQIVKWSKEKPYGSICVLRKCATASGICPSASVSTAGMQGMKPSRNPQESTEKGTKKTKTSISEAAKQTLNLNTSEHASTRPSILDGLIVPFCNRCKAERNNKKRKPGLHHAWCPKNHCFDNSGADDIMVRIIQGRKLGCPACENEFQTGKPLRRIPTGNSTLYSHNFQCLKNQQRLDQEQEERERRHMEDEEEEERHTRFRANANQDTAQPQKESRSKKKSEQKRPSSAHSNARGEPKRKRRLVGKEILYPSSSEEDTQEDEIDDGSVYRPAPKKVRIQTLKVPQPSRKTKQKTTKKSKESTKAKQKGKDQSHLSEDFSRIRVSLEPYNPSVGSRTGLMKPKWVKIEDDPWGTKGYAVGDVALFGAGRGLGHFDISLPSSRYRVHPFETGSMYRYTHYLPHEGLAMLHLKRDMLGKTPWGLKVGRDEFGLACLIKSIERVSPASAASWIGTSTPIDTKSCCLNVNDMILMVNGKPVGGMSEVGLNLELELSAPDLFLAVSRYKLSANVQKPLMNLEQESLKALDTISRDLRYIGWHEIGISVPSNNTTASNLPQKEILSPSAADTIVGDETLKKSNESSESRNDLRSRHMGTKNFEKVARVDSKGQQEDEPMAANGSDAHSSPVDDPNEDSNPWLGCVCGAIHSNRRGGKMFWIQCENCNAWYDVAERCIGFSREDAESKEWNCEACEPCESEEEREQENSTNSRKTLQRSTEMSFATHDTDFDEKREVSAAANGHVTPANQKVLASTTPASPDTLNIAMSLIEIGKEEKDKAETRASLSEKFEDDRLKLQSSPGQRSNGIYNREVGSAPKEKDREIARGMLVITEQPNDQNGILAAASKPNTDGCLVSRRGNEGKRESTQVGQTRVSKRQANRRNESVDAEMSEADLTSFRSALKIGDYIKIQGHSWPGVNVEAGNGWIVSKHFDRESGEKLYDVKYVVGRATAKDISEEFIVPPD